MKRIKILAALLLAAAVTAAIPGLVKAESFYYEPGSYGASNMEGVYEEKIVDAAKSAAGTPYNIMGLTPESGFTATSFVVWCLNESGCGIYKYTDMEHLYARANNVDYAPHAAGDVVFFVRSGVEHAGIYIGDGKALVCGTTVDEITIGSGEWAGYQVLYAKYTPYM